MLAEEDGLGWVGAGRGWYGLVWAGMGWNVSGLCCLWYIYVKVLIVWKCCLGMYKPNKLQGEGM